MSLLSLTYTHTHTHAHIISIPLHRIIPRFFTVVKFLTSHCNCTQVLYKRGDLVSSLCVYIFIVVFINTQGSCVRILINIKVEEEIRKKTVLDHPTIQLRCGRLRLMKTLIILSTICRTHCVHDETSRNNISRSIE